MKVMLLLIVSSILQLVCRSSSRLYWQAKPFFKYLGVKWTLPQYRVVQKNYH